jgi:hypothetical protein
VLAARRSQVLFWILAGAVAALAGWWRLETLDRRPLWLDERWTHDVVRDAPDLGAVWKVAQLDDYQHPPLGYVAAWLAAHENPTRARLRAPALAAGLASIALVAAVGAWLFGRWAGLLAALLASLSIYHVDFSQEARPYMLGVVLTLGLYGALFAYFGSGRCAWLAAFAACALGALHTYHLALLHVGVAAGAAALHALAAARRGDAAAARRHATAFGAAYAAIALGYLPQLENLRGFLATRGLEANHSLAPTQAFAHALFQRWGSGGGATAHLYEAVVLVGVLRLAHRRDAAALAVTGWALAPGAAFALLPFGKYFDIRFLISSLPVFFLLAGAGVDGVARAAARVAGPRGPLVRGLVAGVLVVAFVVPAVRLYETFRASERRCGDFVRDPSIFEADGRLCADHLLLTSIAAEQQWILRSVHPTITLAPERLDAYAGLYRFEDGPPVAIVRRGERLFVEIEGTRVNEIVPETESLFRYRVLPGSSITFERDDQGRVASLLLDRRGRTARAHRQP